MGQDFISRWKLRFDQGRLADLHAHQRGKKPAPGAAKLQARILAWTQQRQPADGSTHWSTRKLGKELGVSHMMIARVMGRAWVAAASFGALHGLRRSGL